MLHDAASACYDNCDTSLKLAESKGEQVKELRGMGSPFMAWTTFGVELRTSTSASAVVAPSGQPSTTMPAPHAPTLTGCARCMYVDDMSRTQHNKELERGVH